MCRYAKPCSFYSLTKVTIGDGNMASFWDAPWAECISPETIAPSIYALSKLIGVWGRLPPMMLGSLKSTLWGVSRFSISGDSQILGISPPNLPYKTMFQTPLCGSSSRMVFTRVSQLPNAQVAGAIRSNMDKVVWKIWAPPKCKIIAWLMIQNRVWTADQIERCRWQMVVCAPFAIAIMNLLAVSILNIATTFAFGLL
jgi:hypothetical protein